MLKRIIPGMVFAALFALGACGGGSDLGDIEKIVDKACKECKDKDCFEKAENEVEAAMEKKFGDKDPDEATGKALKKLEEKWEKCEDAAKKAAKEG